MEQHELDLIAKYSESDPELRELWEKHKEYEQQLQEFEGKNYLSPQEEQELRDLKKRKLAGKTRMYKILEKYSNLEV
jgi:hypothetical protein